MWSKSKVLNLLKKCYIYIIISSNQSSLEASGNLSFGIWKVIDPKMDGYGRFCEVMALCLHIYMDCFTGINSGHSTKWATKNTPIRLSHPKKFGTIVVCILKKPLRRTTHYFMPDQSWFINCIPHLWYSNHIFLEWKTPFFVKKWWAAKRTM